MDRELLKKWTFAERYRMSPRRIAMSLMDSPQFEGWSFSYDTDTHVGALIDHEGKRVIEREFKGKHASDPGDQARYWMAMGLVYMLQAKEKAR